MKAFTLIALLVVSSLLPAWTVAQMLSGYVRDAKTGEPVSNVNIVIINTQQGVSSDNNGHFSLALNRTGTTTLRFSHISYFTENITVQPNQSALNIELQPRVVLVNGTVVTSTRTQRNVKDIPAAVRLITAQQMREKPSVSIDDVLRTDASIVVDRKNGIFSKNASIIMRGLNSSARTLILLDGVPLNKADGGGVNYNRINMEGIEKVEVVKGPGSALFGGNAMGGIVNIISKDISKPLSGSVKIGAGSCNTQSAGFWLSERIKALPKLGWSLNTSYRRGDGYIIIPKETRDSADVKTYLWEYALGVKLAYYFNDSSKLEAGYSYYDDKRGDGTRFYDPDGGYFKYPTHHAYATYRSFFGTTAFTASAYFQFENYQNQKEQVKTDKLPPYSITQYVLYLTDSHRNDAGIWLAATTPAGNNHKITYGSEVRLSNVNASDIYFTATDTITNKANLNLAALFVQDELNLWGNRVKIVAGVRADAVFFNHASFTIASPSVANSYMAVYAKHYPDKYWLAVSPKIGAQYLIKSNNTIYVSYAAGFRPGTLDDMCSSRSISKGFKVANPELKPETIHNVEMGASLSPVRFIRIEPSAYYSIGNNFHYFVGTGDTIFGGNKPKPVLKRENVSRVTVTGAECTLTAQPAKWMNIILSYSYNHSIVKSFDTLRFIAKDLSGKFLTEVPKNRFIAQLNWKSKILNGALIYENTGQLFNDDENTVVIAGYYRLDAKLSRTFLQHYYAALTIQNLTNNTYLDNKGNLGIGRFFMIELAYRF